MSTGQFSPNVARCAMRCPRRVLAYLTLSAALVAGQNPPSHLPPVTSPGVFNVSASILINAPIEKVWDTILDFSSYPDWNPFVRSQVITDGWGVPLEDQTPQEGRYLAIKSHIPPLEGPVNASTPSNPFQVQFAKEQVTHINTPQQYQAAWRYVSAPEWAVDAERWTAVSEVTSDSGTSTFYESQEVYDGAFASTVKALYGEGLQKGFEAQAAALKARLEN
ncbi:hypothetical protein PM082_018993 [Marasmius tenuissimus]|nr:hypothetical protein PM082_018993 [Marasmius tenuissimus]